MLVDQVGTVVRRLRHAAGLSQEELAERCDLHRTYIGAIERGEKTIMITTARKLADAFDLTLAQFFTEVESGLGCPGERDVSEQLLLMRGLESIRSAAPPCAIPEGVATLLN